MFAFRSFVFATIASVIFSVATFAADSDFRSVPVIAHRGAGHEFDENTVEACRQSYERGIRGFETDFRLTRDNELVIMHDGDISRMTGGTGRIEQMTLAEVKQLRTKAHGVPIPSGVDWLGFFKDKPGVMLLLEMKTSEKEFYPDERIDLYVRRLSEAARHTLPPGTYCFTSFDRRSLAAIKKLAPDVLTGLLTSGTPTPELIEDAKKLGCGRLSVNLDTTPRKYAREVKKAGLQLSLWPIASVEDADLAVTFGADILCTDVPSQLLEARKQKK